MKYILTCLCPVWLFLTGCDTSDPSDTANGGSARLHTVSFLMKQGDAFVPSNNQTFFYTSTGQLTRGEYTVYNQNENRFEMFFTTSYTYRDDKIVKVEKRFVDTDDTESVQYTYDAQGRVSLMEVDGDVNTAIGITYVAHDSVRAVYQLSNGNWFIYTFSLNGGNITREKNIDSAQRLTSEIGSYYDDHINPYSLLGYLDPYFINYSKNNKLIVSSTYYVGSAEFVPESYTYTYNEKGLPSTQLVTYRTETSEPKTPMAKYVFEYDY